MTVVCLTFGAVVDVAGVGGGRRLADELVAGRKALLLQARVGREDHQHLAAERDDLLVVVETAVLRYDVAVRVLAVIHRHHVRRVITTGEIGKLHVAYVVIIIIIIVIVIIIIIIIVIIIIIIVIIIIITITIIQ